MSLRKLVIGIGNRDRGDDAAGCLAVDQLRNFPGRDFDLRESNGDISELLEAFQTYEDVLIIDAYTGQKLVRWDGITDPLPATLSGASSHVVGLAQSVELARVLNLLPRRLVILGIPANHFELGAPASPLTLQATESAVAQVLESIK
ncbi:MAG: hypothetical protein A2070_05300 [Bdellovibrionales bacterium GWC1_52_8]|nr:MAG: hypothetical protein A2Z97_15855 [Bdellovibrionales bacterium GWB1_52_6]OFZ04148.1 MAG: hypothetical protein A2X97_15220 [Bdellovibrionales bacterium GWA1_52_35]OFZ34650.1 MAG: hypothetical protein A2070_05300 [Bdellovibrionales bacterium GWC1_52_8]HCM40488.1 hydrogenase maturation protease [Bdellovibrionales bacterium]